MIHSKNLKTSYNFFLETLPSELLVTLSLTDNKSRLEQVVLESLWKSEFYKRASSCLSIDSSINVEVANIEKNRSTKPQTKIDFLIYGTDRVWAVEFLISGYVNQSAIEHSNRLLPGGKYYGLDPDEWLVVDFRSITEDLSDLDSSYCDNLWVVVYDSRTVKMKVTKYNNKGKMLVSDQEVRFLSAGI